MILNPQNYCILRRHRLLGQTTKQTIGSFQTKKIKNISNFEGLGLFHYRYT